MVKYNTKVEKKWRKRGKIAVYSTAFRNGGTAQLPYAESLSKMSNNLILAITHIHKQ